MTVAPSIRLAGPADAGALADLRATWTAESSDAVEPGFAERYAAWLERESGRRLTWLAEASGQPVGMLNLAVFERMPRPGTPDLYWGYVGNAFVLESHRNAGIGAELLSAAVEYARDNGFVRVVLSPSPRSVPFYRRAGFEVAEELMVLRLHAAAGNPPVPAGASR
jgi:GNAT superfamily N-acetyltransferase